MIKAVGPQIRSCRSGESACRQTLEGGDSSPYSSVTHLLNQLVEMLAGMQSCEYKVIYCSIVVNKKKMGNNLNVHQVFKSRSHKIILKIIELHGRKNLIRLIASLTNFMNLYYI